ncbi:MAG TPA: chorismate lyase [Burkholderiaceae bacterium]|nr:chorismate lyase [Burkholderiaceae bacterium]
MAVWSSRRPNTCALRRWLAAPGSLTAHLRRSAERVEVDLRRQGSPIGRPSVARLLRAGRATRHLREVVLRADGFPLVHAWSAVHVAATCGPWRALRGLGHRPLAEVLFRHPRIRRASMQWSKLRPAHPLRRRATAAWGREYPEGPCWARRSVFTRGDLRLVLIEVFSPEVALRRPCPARTPWRGRQ